MVNGLGERLREQRLARKLSQKEVAKALNVSPSVISNYESGERTPSVEILIAFANLYLCSTDYLLGFKKTDADRTLYTAMLSPEQRRLLQNFLSSLDHL